MPYQTPVPLGKYQEGRRVSARDRAKARTMAKAGRKRAVDLIRGKDTGMRTIRTHSLLIGTNISVLTSSSSDMTVRGHEGIHDGGGFDSFTRDFTYPNTVATMAEADSPVAVMPTQAILTDVYATVSTAPTGASLNVTIYQNGTSVLTLSIAASGVLDQENELHIRFEKDDLLTVAVTQVGSTVAGSNLVVSCGFRS